MVLDFAAKQNGCSLTTKILENKHKVFQMAGVTHPQLLHLICCRSDTARLSLESKLNCKDSRNLYHSLIISWSGPTL